RARCGRRGVLRDELAERAADQLARERDLVAVVAQRRRVAEQRVRGGETGVVVEGGAVELLLRGGHAPRHRRDAAEHETHVARLAVADACGRRDRDEREAPRLPLHRLEVRAAALERLLGHAHRGDELARPQRVLAPHAAARGDEEVGELAAPATEARRDLDLRVAGDERGREVGRRHHPALVRADDRVVAVLAVDGEAAVAALEPARHALVAEVPAAVPLQQVAADRAHVAELWGRGVAQRPRDDGEELREGGRPLEVAERRERADAHALPLRVVPAPQAIDAGEVDEPVGTREAVTYQHDEIRAPRERDGAVAQQPQRFPERARLRVGEAHEPASASASASSTRARVIGAWRTRAPVAFATAFATAAAVGMIGGSPRPFAPRLFALRSGRSTKRTTISGTSATVGILYHSRFAFMTRPSPRSTMRSSDSAKPSAWTTPPSTCDAAVSGFTMRPMSCTATIFRTKISPVRTSTSTSAKCAPKVLIDVSSGFGKREPLPMTVLFSSFFEMSAMGVRAPLLTTWPRSIRSSLRGVSSTPAAAARNCSRASFAARRTAGPTDASVSDPALIGPYGPSVSPMRTETCPTSMPSSSAQICASTVRVPVPMSCVPARSTTVPSALKWTVAYAGGPPPPPQICEAIPSPRRRCGVDPRVPPAFRRDQPISRAPIV